MRECRRSSCRRGRCNRRSAIGRTGRVRRWPPPKKTTTSAAAPNKPHPRPGTRASVAPRLAFIVRILRCRVPAASRPISWRREEGDVEGPGTGIRGSRRLGVIPSGDEAPKVIQTARVR
ncbi:unnamed protein product [Nesidiocoris tenuis]|uniref:Uncharacterized protein n=1 Tax=Nesidiocoris tenuis TaxID=355587 RepID=A0A6H5HM62_9HEMI|nr:unnamed protein product [Nesidiocoris tenuis]